MSDSLTNRDLLERVLAQTEKTNGRVIVLEESHQALAREAAVTKRVLYGDPLDLADHGLVGISKDVRRVVESHDRVVRVVMWAAAVVGGALLIAAVTWVTG